MSFPQTSSSAAAATSEKRSIEEVEKGDEDPENPTKKSPSRELFDLMMVEANPVPLVDQQLLSNDNWDQSYLQNNVIGNMQNILGQYISDQTNHLQVILDKTISQGVLAQNSQMFNFFQTSQNDMRQQCENYKAEMAKVVTQLNDQRATNSASDEMKSQLKLHILKLYGDGQLLAYKLNESEKNLKAQCLSTDKLQMEQKSMQAEREKMVKDRIMLEAQDHIMQQQGAESQRQLLQLQNERAELERKQQLLQQKEIEIAVRESAAKDPLQQEGAKRRTLRSRQNTVSPPMSPTMRNRTPQRSLFGGFVPQNQGTTNNNVTSNTNQTAATAVTPGTNNMNQNIPNLQGSSSNQQNYTGQHGTHFTPNNNDSSTNQPAMQGHNSNQQYPTAGQPTSYSPFQNVETGSSATFFGDNNNTYQGGINHTNFNQTRNDGNNRRDFLDPGMSPEYGRRTPISESMRRNSVSQPVRYNLDRDPNVGAGTEVISKGGSLCGEIILPKNPPTPSSLINWHTQLITAVMAATNYTDKREIKWLNEVIEASSIDDLIEDARDSSRFQPIQAKLSQALMHYPKMTTDIHNLLERETVRAYRKHQEISGRQQLFLYYQEIRPSAAASKQNINRKLQNLNWYGDNKIVQFYSEWQNIRDENAVFAAVSKDILQSHLERILAQSQKMSLTIDSCYAEEITLEMLEKMLRRAAERSRKLASETALTVYQDSSKPQQSNRRKNVLPYPCRWFMNGHCSFGDRCRFSHDPKHLKDKQGHQPTTLSKGSDQKGTGKSKGFNKGKGKGNDNADKGKGKGKNNGQSTSFNNSSKGFQKGSGKSKGKDGKGKGEKGKGKEQSQNKALVVERSDESSYVDSQSSWLNCDEYGEQYDDYEDATPMEENGNNDSQFSATSCVVYASASHAVTTAKPTYNSNFDAHACASRSVAVKFQPSPDGTVFDPTKEWLPGHQFTAIDQFGRTRYLTYNPKRRANKMPPPEVSTTIHWFLDTGSSIDVISEKASKEFKILKDKCNVNVKTANGFVTANDVAVVPIPELSSCADAAVLGDSPSLLSVGYRCMELGFSFHWPAGKSPHLVTPNEKRVDLVVRNYVPVLTSDTTKGKELLEHCLAVKHFDENYNPIVRLKSEQEEDERNAQHQSPVCVLVPSHYELSNANFKALNESSYELRKNDMVKELVKLMHPKCCPAEQQDSENNSVKEEEPEVTERPKVQDTINSNHYLTHLPALPKLCEACRVGKTRDVKRFANKFRRELTAFGDIITCDHLDFLVPSVGEGSDHGCSKALVIHDLYSGFLACMPVKRQDEECTYQALLTFIDPRKKPLLIYSDNAGGIQNAVARLGVPWETSQPGVPRNNSRIERQNQLLLDGIRSLLSQSGLPNCFWAYAAQTFCFHYNRTSHTHKDTPYKRRFEEEAPSTESMFAFGSKVLYRPSSVIKQEKLDPRLQVGVFVGYREHPGMKWKGEYKVIGINSFVKQHLYRYVPYSVFADDHAHITKVCKPPVHLFFPLLRKSKELNETVEGLEKFIDEVKEMEDFLTVDRDELYKPDEADKSSDDDNSYSKNKKKRPKDKFKQEPSITQPPIMQDHRVIVTRSVSSKALEEPKPKPQQPGLHSIPEQEENMVRVYPSEKDSLKQVKPNESVTHSTNLRSTPVSLNEVRKITEGKDSSVPEPSLDVPAEAADTIPKNVDSQNIEPNNVVINDPCEVPNKVNDGSNIPIPDSSSSDENEGVIERKSEVSSSSKNDTEKDVNSVKATQGESQPPSHFSPSQGQTSPSYTPLSSPSFSPNVDRSEARLMPIPGLPENNSQGMYSDPGRIQDREPKGKASQLIKSIEEKKKLFQQHDRVPQAQKLPSASKGIHKPTPTFGHPQHEVQNVTRTSSSSRTALQIPTQDGYHTANSDHEESDVITSPVDNTESEYEPAQSDQVNQDAEADQSNTGDATSQYSPSYDRDNNAERSEPYNLRKRSEQTPLSSEDNQRRTVISYNEPKIDYMIAHSLRPRVPNKSHQSTNAVVETKCLVAENHNDKRNDLHDDDFAEVKKDPKILSSLGSLSSCLAYDIGEPLLPAPEHRDEFQVSRIKYSCVARPVKTKELWENQEAWDALELEWHKLRSKQVWDEKTVREKREVISNAQRTGETVHFGRLNGLCFEKNAELAKDDPKRKYKGRVVFLGNRVQDENWAQALFQDLGSSPATMEAGKTVDAYGCIPGNAIQQADAEQAYIQADLKGPKLWLSLPRENWPKSWEKYYNPVCLMKKALYGHPDSGTFWEQHCNTRLRKVGFVPIAGWNSCFFHEKLKLFLLVYVDDFKLSGPAQNLPLGWSLIAKHITLDEAKEVSFFLGCTHVLSRNGSVTSISYCMKGQLEAAISVYEEELDKLGVKINKNKKSNSPFLNIEVEHPAATPQVVDVKTQCPKCKHQYRTGKTSRKIKKKDVDSPGFAGVIALKVLMKIMYAARMVRYDLLMPVSYLARNITKWSALDDEALDKLISYLRATLDIKLQGFVGDPMHNLRLDVYSDASFAGLASQHSTTGSYLSLVGPNTRFPLLGASKKQTSVSTSTSEAELTAIFLVVRNVALPAMDLWDALLDRKVIAILHEDNTAVIQIMRTGRNATMRHFERTHRVPVAWLHEIYHSQRNLRIKFAKTDDMIADLFTKTFTDLNKFQSLRLAIGLSRSLAEFRKIAIEMWKNGVCIVPRHDLAGVCFSQQLLSY